MTVKAIGLEQPNEKDRNDIDRQVERILSHPLFHQSKRLPAFLRYIVDTSLSQGGTGTTKERTVGVEVFGRRPDYDNNSDPIVRVTATELRKKLAQYYYEDGHNDEIRIELPPGSYLPRFRRSREEDEVASNEAAEAKESPATVVTSSELPVEASVDASEQPTAASAVVEARARVSWPAIAIACTLLGAVIVLLVQRSWSASNSSLDRFWSSLSGSSGRVFIVMPVIGSDNIKATDAPSRSVSVSPNLSLEDTDIAARIASQLERHGSQYQMVSSSAVSLDQLQGEPAVLIGALDNVWTMRLMQHLPFVFEEAPDHRTGRILDVASGGTKSWMVDIDMPHTRIARDYGIVARFTNGMTGEPVVVVAGISSQGTQAAGRLLTSKDFEAIRPIAANSTNFEVIIETEAVDGHAGRPQVVASKTWSVPDVTPGSKP